MTSQLIDEVRIDPVRFQEIFDGLAAFGAFGRGGVNRPAFSLAHREVRRWFLAKAEELGLEPLVDGAGNHSARLNCGPAGKKTLLIGSHLDSVPQGGRFDGALGVAAGLEILAAVRSSGLALGCHLEVVDFTDEEGRVFGMLGSRAMAGRIDPGELLAANLEPHGLDPEEILAAARRPQDLAGYFELHVEQGRTLESAGADVGAATAIVGLRVFRFHFLGRADHAGTVRLEDRQDPAPAAGAFAAAVREHVQARFPEAVATIGNMEFFPGASNVVPEKVTVWVDFRAASDQDLDRLERDLGEITAREAERFRVGFEAERLESILPVETDGRFQKALEGAAEVLGYKNLSLPSGAGHDVQSLAGVCPIGLLFVPSQGGASHSEREFTPFEACLKGAEVLLRAVLETAGEQAS